MFILRPRGLKSLWLLLLVRALPCGQAVQAPPAAAIRMAMVEGLSGPFANTGEAVYRKLLWAVQRVKDFLPHAAKVTANAAQAAELTTSCKMQRFS